MGSQDTLPNHICGRNHDNIDKLQSEYSCIIFPSTIGYLDLLCLLSLPHSRDCVCLGRFFIILFLLKPLHFHVLNCLVHSKSKFKSRLKLLLFPISALLTVCVVFFSHFLSLCFSSEPLFIHSDVN